MRILYQTVLVLVCLFQALSAQQKLQVTVSIEPQKYFVQRIGGDLVEVEVMVPAGYSPHIYEPKPRQMVKLSDSKIYFAVGVQFENVWLDRIAAANSSIRIIHTQDGIEKIAIHEEDEHEEESEGHDHGEYDPHIWLSPPLVMLQARYILNALIDIDPGKREIYIRNYTGFINELAALDLELMTLFSTPGQKKEFIVFHPAWGYFAQAYGLKQLPVEIEGKELKPADLMNLINYAKDNEIKVVFVQPQISPQSAEMIAREIGGETVSADPLSADWLANMKIVAQKFKEVLVREQ